MAAGDLTLTHVYEGKVSGAAIKAAVEGTTLAATSDHLLVIPNNKGVNIIKVERAAA